MTIAAIVTAHGQGAVSIIRISGEASWDIAQKLSKTSFKANNFNLTWLYEGNQKIDQVLVLPFKSPRSFTGEDVIELHCHGSTWLSQKILNLVLDSGARLAKPGEFSQRAFMNHKLDLSQAEAIMDLVSSKTSLSGENAVNLYQGHLGQEIYQMRSELMNLLGEVIAGIDFPDEVGDLEPAKFIAEIESSIVKINHLLDSEEEGHILRHGFKIALVGDPNVGKSSLMNALLKNERAIVTDIAGTTRDTIEESYSINGVPVVLIDTAGIRESTDLVERIGIERSKKAIDEADLVLFLQDINEEIDANDKEEFLNKKYDIDLAAKRYLFLGTKSDLRSGSSKATSQLTATKLDFDLEISALKETNLEELKGLVFENIIRSDSPVKINERQADLLRQSKSALEKSLLAVKDNLPQDFWTVDLKAAIHSLGEITGAVVTEELLDNIFSSFCIGK